jgi:hypothetical protein
MGFTGQILSMPLNVTPSLSFFSNKKLFLASVDLRARALVVGTNAERVLPLSTHLLFCFFVLIAFFSSQGIFS